MGANYTNACVNAPSPTQPTFAPVDDTYADWCLSRHGKEVDHSLVPSALNGSQGLAEAEAGAMWELHQQDS